MKYRITITEQDLKMIQDATYFASLYFYKFIMEGNDTSRTERRFKDFCKLCTFFECIEEGFEGERVED